ncbi:MAG: HlyD family efflux transporter periplasmic adaptor subunit [Leptolyngbya sp. SIO1E4]|nr:HlyD family efflux transporter periplasmic adaptor subunit [Leptolyngbya sp. SIO1E4]
MHAESASNLNPRVHNQAARQPAVSSPPHPPIPPSPHLSNPEFPSTSSIEDFLSLDALPPIRRWTQWGGMAIAVSVGIATVLVAVTPYRVTIPAEATVRPVGELKQIEAPTAGTVVAIAASENQTVQAGEVIARIDDAPLQTRKNQLQTNIEQAQRQLQQIEAQRQTLDRQIQAEGDRGQRLISAASAELRQTQRSHQDQQIAAITEVEAIEAQLRSEAASLAAAQLQVQRYEPLAATGAISQEQLEAARLAVQQQNETISATQARLRQAQAGLNPSDAAVAIAQARIAQEQASSESTLAALTQEQEALMQQFLEVQQQQIQDQHALHQVNQDLQQTIIRAPVTGTLFQLDLRNPGQTVAAGDTIASIAPNESALTIKALVSTTAIHQVAVGQPAQVRISACPYPDYGTLPGTVQTISPDIVNAQVTAMAPESPVVSGAQSGTFEVTVTPEVLSFGPGSHQCSLRPGMTGRADIMTEEETVLTFLLRKAKLLTDL